MNQIELTVLVAVVTGGAQGIGHAIGERLLRSGAELAIWDIDGRGSTLSALGHGARACGGTDR